MSDSIRYTPLEEGHFRLVTLYPGEPEDEITIEVFPVALTVVADNYIALSYWWGSPTRTKFVRIKSSHAMVPITENLWDALDALRSDWDLNYQDKRYRWIDQLCINQDDLEERALQINMMGEIYASAQSVFIWLSKDMWGYAGLPDALHRYVKMCDNIRTAGRAWQYWYRKSPGPEMSDVPQLFWDILKELFANEYWRRLWIVQEIVKAKDVKVLCGRVLMSWDLMEYVASNVTNVYTPQWLPGYSGQISPGAIAFDMINTIRQEARREPSAESQDYSTFSLGELIKWTWDSKTSEPLDRFFSLLGLTNPSSYTDGQQLQVDYKASPRDLLLQVFADEIIHGSCEKFDFNPTRSGQVPSWVCDPDVERPVRPSFSGNPYNAAAHTLKSVRAATVKHDKLSVAVRFIGHIHRIRDIEEHNNYVPNDSGMGGNTQQDSTTTSQQTHPLESSEKVSHLEEGTIDEHHLSEQSAASSDFWKDLAYWAGHFYTFVEFVLNSEDVTELNEKPRDVCTGLVL